MTNVKVYFVNDVIDQLKIDTWDTLLNDYDYWITARGQLIIGQNEQWNIRTLSANLELNAGDKTKIEKLLSDTGLAILWLDVIQIQSAGDKLPNGTVAMETRPTKGKR